MENRFQRIGAISNSHIGKEFENVAKDYFLTKGLTLDANIKLKIGLGENKKYHTFDLGCHEQKVIVECKSHKWTTGFNVPSAKLTVWNEAMYYFYLAPKEFRKIMFVLRDLNSKRQMSLADYYIKTYSHIIPQGVEFWEYDEGKNDVRVLKVNN